VSQSACFSHGPGVSRWPALPGRTVVIGGVPVTCAQAASAADALARAGGAAVRQVLAAAGSPLAGCDYRAASAPFTLAGGPPGQYGRGAAGRPVIKTAFIRAIRLELAAAEAAEPARLFAAELEGARAAFRGDSGYAAAMATAALAVREKDRAAAARPVAVSAADYAASADAAA
jgi:hypothetical protein